MPSSTSFRRVRLPACFVGALLLARLFPLPPLSDPTGAALPGGLQLSAPAFYVLLAPLFSLWDGISMLSMSRLKGFLAGTVILYAGWRIGVALLGRARGGVAGPSGRAVLMHELKVLVGSLAGFLAFLLAGALWHRPMLALTDTAPDDVIVDLHSHTNVSHDVKGTLMRGFDAEANRRWHARSGFDAVFITDHNTTAGWRALRDDSALPAVCPGIEVSAWQAHIVLLGDTLEVDRSLYDRSLDGLLRLLAESRTRYGALAVASLPEYERSHWNRLDTLVQAGLAGFEIANAAPKANELTRVRRDSVIALARHRDLFLAGVSDSHGWGATSMAWSLVRVAGWRERMQVETPRSSRPLCEGILRALGNGGFGAVRVVERQRLRPDAAWPSWLTPEGVIWVTWRSMPWLVALGWFGWLACWAGLRLRGAPQRPTP
jgi:hypothetical protein